MKLLHVVGNRPHFVKFALLHREAKKHKALTHKLVHTGQHYDFGLSGVFFRDLSLPQPDHNLGVGSSTHAIQTGEALQRLDVVLAEERPDVVVVYGDTNSTLAGALAARKRGVPVAHVEAGLREHTWRAEELNRRLTDYCGTFLFCPTRKAEENLRDEGVPHQRVFLTGDITYDAYLEAAKHVAGKRVESVPAEFILVTIHRAEAVDHPDTLREVMRSLEILPLPVVFPVHPRTEKALRAGLLWNGMAANPRVELREPVGYFEFLTLLQQAALVVTDSGGVIKEAFYARKPCVTVDYTNEYMEIYETGAGILAGRSAEGIARAAERLIEYDCSRIDPASIFGDGCAATRMARVLARGGDAVAEDA